LGIRCECLEEGEGVGLFGAFPNLEWILYNHYFKSKKK
jgi:hypothetical protein